MLRPVLTLFLVGGLWLAPALAGQARVAAQDSEPKSAQDDRAETFQAVSGGVKEDVAGGPLMLAAYAVVWVTLFGYVWRLNRLQRGVESNLERLERTVARESASAR
jgi:CcmD family protein